MIDRLRTMEEMDATPIHDQCTMYNNPGAWYGYSG